MNRKLKIEELNRLSIEEFKTERKSGIAVVLDNIRSLSNVGSVFRTADAFLINEIHLCGITPCPPHREIQKTALGSTESVHWEYYADTLESINSLREKGYQLLALEQAENSIPLNELEAGEEKIALVLGNEVYGVQQEVIDACQACVEIPQFGTKHSLNVASSASIAMWELWSKKQKSRK